MPRKPHTYHYIYRTTCKLNGTYYIGMHSTSDLEDGYLGSGQRLWRSIRKYGTENFEKEILEFLPDRKTLAQRESELMTSESLKDPLCMNLKPGGAGGWTREQRRKGALNMHVTMRKDPSYEERRLQGVIAFNKRRKPEQRGKGFLGKKHTPEYCAMIARVNSEKQKGDKNSQYGTIWITNGIESRKIRKGEDIPTGWHRGRRKVS